MSVTVPVTAPGPDAPVAVVAPSRRRPRWRRLAGALVAALLVAGAGVGVAGAVAGSGGFRLVAVFRNAGDVLRGSVVRVDGVAAGTVTALSIRHNQAVLTLNIDRQFLPIHRDARIEVRPVSLLGARYLALDPGTPSSPALPDGGVIPATQTADAVNIQDLFNVLNDPTSTALAALVASLGQGVAGQGPNIAATLHALAPVLGNVQPMLRLLDSQDHVLQQLVSEVQPIAAALATGHGSQLAGLVASASSVLQAAGAQSKALGATVAQLPATLATARGALGQLGNLAQQATPALASLAPLTTTLSRLVQELQSFSQAANPALPALDPVLTSADQLLVTLRPVVAQLQPAGPSLQQLAASAQPIVTQLTANLSNLFGFIRNWALVTNGSDAVSHYFRAMMMANPNAVTGNSPVTVPGVGPFAGGQPPSLPSVTLPLPKTVLPNLNTLTDPLSKAVGGMVGGLLPGSTPSSSGSSGAQAAGSPASPAASSYPLSGAQIGSLLRQVVGGS